MTQTEHILALIEECDKSGYSESEKKKIIDLFLKPDYVPKNAEGCQLYKNKPINIAKALPGMRCVQIVARDPQSGPIYCGEPAYLYAEADKNPGMFFVFCKSHASQHKIEL